MAPQQVAVISQNFAEREWGSAAAAIGKRLRRSPTTPWIEVIGVAGDIRLDGVDQPAPDAIYLTSSEGLAQYASRSRIFLVRSERVGTPGFLREIEQAVWSVNGKLPLGSVQTLGRAYDRSMARTSLTLVLLAITGAMALALGLVGIYGVLSYVLTQRTREIGIRMALGAQAAHVRRMLLGHVLALVGVGVAARLGRSRAADAAHGIAAVRRHRARPRNVRRRCRRAGRNGGARRVFAGAARYARRSDVGAQSGIARYNEGMAFLIPSGPFGVGSVTRELVDRGRPSHLLSDTAGRRLFLKLWYPAERGTGDDDERIWQDLRNDARTPALVRVLLGCLRARTATRVNGRFVARAPMSSVVAYNHGLVSFAAENTSLMQELASHGYTVVAIQHAEQLAEFKALSRAEPPEKKKADAELAQRLKDASSAERPTLAVEYFQASTNTNRVVVERAADTSFVLGRIADVVAKIPSLRSNAIDTSSAHLVGFSLGGAVATETAKRDARALSVVNLDGGMYGTLDTKAPSQPYSDAVQQRERRRERQAAAPTRTARSDARHYPSQLSRPCGAGAAVAARPRDGANESASVSGGAQPARAGVPFPVGVAVHAGSAISIKRTL